MWMTTKGMLYYLSIQLKNGVLTLFFRFLVHVLSKLSTPVYSLDFPRSTLFTSTLHLLPVYSLDYLILLS
jgi:hypothetical protein